MLTPELKQEIVKEFKNAGLELTEEAAIKLVQVAFKVLPKVLVATENKADDMLIPLLMIIEPKVIELLGKIDGK